MIPGVIVGKSHPPPHLFEKGKKWAEKCPEYVFYVSNEDSPETIYWETRTNYVSYLVGFRNLRRHQRNCEDTSEKIRVSKKKF